MKQFILYIFSLLNYIYPKSKNKIIFISSPDFTDNSFAFFKYLVENNTNNYRYIWLVDNFEKISLYDKIMLNYITQEQRKSIEVLSKKSFLGMFTYIQSKYIFFTHGFYTGMSIPRNQTRVNLWHGMPLKAIGYLNQYGDNSTIPKSTYALATSELFQDIMSQVFFIDTQKVLVSGQPRCDLLFEDKEVLKDLNIDKNSYKKIIFWAPTFRYSKNHKIKDGKFKNTLPLLSDGDLDKLNIFLCSQESYMVIKLHPMDILNKKHFEKYSHLQILKDDILPRRGHQLYNLLAEVDILITDFSSIYIDFLLLDRPIIFAINDFSTYKKTRNFVFTDVQKYMPGKTVTNLDALHFELQILIENNIDVYVSQRRKMKEKFHRHDDKFSERLAKMLRL